jgi:hypothetical protein
MIIKYLKEGVWGYIDNIRQVASDDIEPLELAAQYDKEVKEGKREDLASVGVDMDSIKESNKAFLLATENLDADGLNPCHMENLLVPQRVTDNYPAKVILLYVEENREFDSIVLVTNETVYLMNDKGQTIERLN